MIIVTTGIQTETDGENARKKDTKQLRIQKLATIGNNNKAGTNKVPVLFFLKNIKPAKLEYY